MKKIIILLLVLSLPVAFLSAQAANNYTIMSFDIGYGMGVDVDNGDVDPYAHFGINFRVAAPFSIGAMYSNLAGDDLAMLKLKYDAVDAARVVIGFGTDGTGPIASIGMEIVPLKRMVSGIATELKLATEYVFDIADIADGRFVIGLMVGVGF